MYSETQGGRIAMIRVKLSGARGLVLAVTRRIPII